MVTVYGADWCEDTQRSLRLMRRLGARHAYLNVDQDAAALARAKELNHGRRRTPTIEMDGEVLVEPPNELLTNALVRHAEITEEEVRERMRLQNVGDVERAVRVASGLFVLALLPRVPRPARLLVGAVALTEALSGAAGWCPIYAAAGVTSLEGPGDRPAEAERTDWLTRAG